MQKNLYYIHQPEDWTNQDIDKITRGLNSLNLRYSDKAAIGEGAGGSGFVTFVEVLINHPITYGIISALIWDITKLLWNNKPKKKVNLPPQINLTYKLVIHTKDHHIIGIKLDDDINEIETAVKELPKIIKDKRFSRAYQNGEYWDIYS